MWMGKLYLSVWKLNYFNINIEHKSKNRKIILLWTLYRYWDVSDKAVVGSTKTCFNEQEDGSCEEVNIPECKDRTVRCSIIPNPNSVQSQIDSPAEMTVVGNAPNLKDLQQLDTELQYVAL